MRATLSCPKQSPTSRNVDNKPQMMDNKRRHASHADLKLVAINLPVSTRIESPPPPQLPCHCGGVLPEQSPSCFNEETASRHAFMTVSGVRRAARSGIIHIALQTRFDVISLPYKCRCEEGSCPFRRSNPLFYDVVELKRRLPRRQKARAAARNDINL